MTEFFPQIEKNGVLITIIIFLLGVGSGVGKYFYRTRGKVQVHEAFFGGDPYQYYFIKVKNQSIKAPITINHIWVEDRGKKINIVNAKRPLPHTLNPTKIWETWIRKDNINDQKNIFKNIRVKLSTDRILKSEKNKNVPTEGFVAGNIENKKV